MRLQGFNANDHADLDDFSPIPAGDYAAVIIDSCERETNKQDGHYLNLTLEVIEGEFKGRRLFDILNLDNPNTKAVEIAQRALASICRAVGNLTPNDSSELHNIPLVVKVKIEAARNGYGPSNKITNYLARGAATLAAEKPAGNVPAWMRKA